MEASAGPTGALGLGTLQRFQTRVEAYDHTEPRGDTGCSQGGRTTVGGVPSHRGHPLGSGCSRAQ